MTFEEFCKITREAIEKGEVVTTAELTELDLAVQYAIGQEIEAQGREIKADAEQIYYLIGKYCGEETRDRLLPE